MSSQAPSPASAHREVVLWLVAAALSVAAVVGYRALQAGPGEHRTSVVAAAPPAPSHPAAASASTSASGPTVREVELQRELAEAKRQLQGKAVAREGQAASAIRPAASAPPVADVLAARAAACQAQARAFVAVSANPAWPVQGLPIWRECLLLTKGKLPQDLRFSVADTCNALLGNGMHFVRAYHKGASQQDALRVARELRKAPDLLNRLQVTELDAWLAVPAAAASKPAPPASAAV